MRVAVVSVHGVGDQAPLDTVRRIGDLLQDIDVPPLDPRETPPPCTSARPAKPAYYPFREQPIRINVRPTVVAPEQGETPASGVRGPFQAYVDSKWDGAAKPDLSQEFITAH